jgi:2-phospho-L-lactate guanylyltransferase
MPVWAVVPIKDTGAAKQRLAGLLPADARRRLALAMAEDVLATLAAVLDLAGIAVVTVDPDAAALAARYGAQVWTDGAHDGHTGAVTAAAIHLARSGAGMLALPADIPLVRPEDIGAVLAAGGGVPGFTIVPAHDRRGSNAVLCRPATAVPLRFGDDSFVPHLAAARAAGIEPVVVARPGIALDLDRPEDIAQFMAMPSETRARALLEGLGFGAAQEGNTGP